MVERMELITAMRKALKRSPVLMLTGPRQCGKTTLARQFMRTDRDVYFDLEDPAAAQALEDPMTTLRDMRGLVVIDEAQRQPKLFPVLRVLADRPRKPARFLLLGSASPDLSRQASESLAGRVELMEIRGFGTHETGIEKASRLWLRGGFPRSYLARSEADSYIWRNAFIQTFLERDLGVLGFNMAPKVMGRFWSMLSHYHGQVWNGSEIGAALGVTYHTAASYLDALEQTYMVRRLLPWFENVGKRVVKSPKIYIKDSGLFHSLQRVRNMQELLHHPKLGASWEGFVIEEALAAFGQPDAYFYGVHAGSELDLFFFHKGKRIGIEIKREDAPRMTKSMHVALTDLKLNKLYVIYPGEHRYALVPKVECVPFTQLALIV